MSNMIPLCVTIDHDRIRSWAEQMQLRPALAPLENRTYPIVFADGALDPGMVELDWEHFFLQFESANAALVFRALAKDVKSMRDIDYSFVNRVNVPELTGTSKSTVVERMV